MSLEKSLLASISEEAEKLCLRHHAYHNSIAVENKRKKERLKDPVLMSPVTPGHWGYDKKFNPFYVKKNAGSIAKSISRKIKKREYVPRSPVTAKIPKPSGGTRNVTMYQIPDSAVSKLFYQRLLRKNRHRFSSFSYAYRNDRNVHFAIQDISIELSKNTRMFVAEFDFSKYFDSISHDFLYDQFDENGFFISGEERDVIKAFLSEQEGGVGIPQGTSVSLFLANLACWKMDRSLEREGLRFARYADDTIVWSKDYSKITKAYDLISEFSNEAGVKINEEKSDGISLLVNDSMPAEFSSRKTHVEFLGYSVSNSNVSIKRESVNKIKKQISYILYKHLIQPLKSTPPRAVKVPSRDKDEALLGAMCEIRRYLYGNLTEDMIYDYLMGRSNRIFFKGVMSFYPIIDDEEQLRKMDGWLVNAVFKAVQKRDKLFHSHGMVVSHYPPFSLSRKALIDYCAKAVVKDKKLLKIPSFLVIYRAMKKGLVELGLTAIVDPMSNAYNYRS